MRELYHEDKTWVLKEECDKALSILRIYEEALEAECICERADGFICDAHKALAKGKEISKAGES